MAEMINPYKEFVAEITPTDFEKYCLEILNAYAKKENLQQFKIVHDTKIETLADKVRSLGAQKGILISTSGFQSGAVKYAKEHGIALIQIFNKSVRFIQMSAFKDIDERYLLYQRLFPQYYACEYDEYGLPLEEIYPTKEEVKKICEVIRDRFE